MTTRRDFLKTSSLLGFGATVPAFLGRTAFAAPPADKPGAAAPVNVAADSSVNTSGPSDNENNR